MATDKAPGYISGSLCWQFCCGVMNNLLDLYPLFSLTQISCLVMGTSFVPGVCLMETFNNKDSMHIALAGSVRVDR